MCYFFIDFENTGCNGLQGLENLTENDNIIILYSGDVKIPIDMAQQLHKLCNRAIYYKNQIKQLNALDFQIVYWIGYISGIKEHNNQKQTDIIIVSNDKGYDVINNTIDYLNIENIKITRCQSISSYFNNDIDNTTNTSNTNPKYASININPILQHIKSKTEKVNKQSRTDNILRNGLKLILKQRNTPDVNTDINHISKKMIPYLKTANKTNAMELLSPYFTEKQSRSIYIAILRTYRAISKQRKNK